ncbi:hypothetical protein BSKO_10725 [Bryopsis sp. KO-2023]|nr:hypothetical protein BSKO_10725 [Bryopsis sp. KO-2023]
MHTSAFSIQHAQSHPCKKSERLIVKAGAGFGSQSASKKPSKKNKKNHKIKRGTKAVDKALQLVEGKERKARPIDPKEAAKGKVDFAKVKDWGSGEPSDLGSLELESFSENADATNKPFYERMAKQLELLQAKGALNIAQEELPDFKKWSFKEKRYRQYLVDQLHVHRVLEESVAKLLIENDDSTGGMGLVALSELSSKKGLDRRVELAHDIQAMDSSRKSDSNEEPMDMQPSLSTTAYGKYLSQIFKLASSGDTDAEKNEGVCRLIAHIYSVRVYHLTSGGRVGATATEKLELFQRGAVKAYQSYPDFVDDPLKQFVSCINKCGGHLSFAEKEFVLDELAASFKKTAIMLTPLARED